VKSVENKIQKAHISILMVCHGNICRSPMAEFVFNALAAQSGLSSRVRAASAATSDEEIWNGVGNPVYPPARDELARHGISCEGKRAVQLCRQDYGKYDYLIGMDDANVRNMRRILGGDSAGKIFKMMEFAGDGWKLVSAGKREMERAADVADPWYTRDFGATWRDVEAGCRGFLSFLRETYGW